MSKKLNWLSLTEAKSLLDKGEISSAQLTEAHLEAHLTGPDLNAFITATPEHALSMARSSDEKRAKGEAGLLEGLPIAIKDLFCTKEIKTTAGSAILGNFIPPYESTVTGNLWGEGAVCLGKLNMDEFAMGSSNITSHFGPVRNPWTAKDAEVSLVPGGSSGGSAASVAGRMVMAATGTDTGGSIRQPASFTGITGMKPTYGRCSRWGIVAFASSLDQAGPMTRSVADAALMLEAMAGFDEKDNTSADLAVPSWSQNLNSDLKGKKIGIPKEYLIDGMDEDVTRLWEEAARKLKNRGAEIVDISLKHTSFALPTYYIVGTAEASSNLARYDGMRYGLREDGDNLIETYKKSRAKGFGEEVQRRILLGTFVLSAGYYDAYYKKAQRVRRKIVEDFQQAFLEVDAILTPTSPDVAFEEGKNMDDPIAMYLQDIFTVPASLAGLPGISVPVGLNRSELPLGMQVLGKAWDEQSVFDVALALEEEFAFDAIPHGLKT